MFVMSAEWYVVGVRILVQDHKSLCAAVMIRDILVNTHTHTDTDRFRLAIYDELSVSRAKSQRTK